MGGKGREFERVNNEEREKNKEREASGKPFPSLLFVSVLNFIPFFVLWFHLLVKKKDLVPLPPPSSSWGKKRGPRGSGVKSFPSFCRG